MVKDRAFNMILSPVRCEGEKGGVEKVSECVWEREGQRDRLHYSKKSTKDCIAWVQL